MTAQLADAIDFKILVRADMEKVFAALSTAAGLDGWFTDGTEIEARKGGRLLFRWRDWGVDRYNGQAGGPVLECVPPRKLVFQWNSHPDSRDMMTTVEWTLEADGRGTVARVREHGFPDTPLGRKALLENASGWGEAFTLIKFYVEHGKRY